MTDDLLVVFSPGGVMIGREKGSSDSLLRLKDPRLMRNITHPETGQQGMILVPLVGNPDLVMVPRTCPYALCKDSVLETVYVKETTGLTIPSNSSVRAVS